MTKEQIHQAHLDILLVSENNVIKEAEKQTELTVSAMEEQSIKFAEWCEHNYTKMSNGLWAGNFTYNEHGEYTTKQLYKLFNEL